MRQTECIYYPGCLDEAAKQPRMRLECGGCDRYERRTLEPVDDEFINSITITTPDATSIEPVKETEVKRYKGYRKKVREAIALMPEEFSVDEMASLMGLTKEERRRITIELPYFKKTGVIDRVTRGFYKKIKGDPQLAINNNAAEEEPFIVILSGVFAENPEMMEGLKEAVREQFRTLEGQIMWYVKRGLKIDRIKAEAEKAKGNHD